MRATNKPTTSRSSSSGSTARPRSRRPAATPARSRDTSDRRGAARRVPVPADAAADFPRLALTRADLADPATAGRFEWLETNGLGGYAFQAVNGDLPRRYSGLFVAAVRPPVERRLVLAGLDETIDGPAGTFELGVHRYPDAAGSLEPGVHHPRGDRHLEGFDRWPFPRHTWLAGPYRFERRVIVIHGFNAVLLRYRLLDADAAVRLEMTPLTAFRDHHDNRHESASPAQLATAGPRRDRTVAGSLCLAMTRVRYDTSNHALLVSRLLESAARISDSLEPVDADSRPRRRMTDSPIRATVRP